MSNNLEFMKEHNCKHLKNCKFASVVKYQYSDDKKGWYIQFGNVIHGIKYCPYCGMRLEDEMEDRYLFKAKRIDNGEWEIGSLIALPTGEYEISNKCNNPPDCDPMWDKVAITHKVDPSTICQCTGLKDKNGKLIWENDIMKYQLDGKTRIDVVKYEPPMFSYKNVIRWSLYQDEVIGNIFDNPELLESEE